MVRRRKLEISETIMSLNSKEIWLLLDNSEDNDSENDVFYSGDSESHILTCNCYFSENDATEAAKELKLSDDLDLTPIKFNISKSA